jgi:hypothetical protein
MGDDGSFFAGRWFCFFFFPIMYFFV